MDLRAEGAKQKSPRGRCGSPTSRGRRRKPLPRPSRPTPRRSPPLGVLAFLEHVRLVRTCLARNALVVARRDLVCLVSVTNFVVYQPVRGCKPTSFAFSEKTSCYIHVSSWRENRCAHWASRRLSRQAHLAGNRQIGGTIAVLCDGCRRRDGALEVSMVLPYVGGERRLLGAETC